MLELLSALGATIGALLLLRLALRFGGLAVPGRGARHLRVVESAALGPRQRLHLVEVGGDRLLVAATDASIVLLHRLAGDAATPASVAATEPASGPGFGAASDPAPIAISARRRGWLRFVRVASLALLAACCFAPASAHAEAASTLPAALGELVKPERISTTVQIVVLMTLVSLVPSILLMATCFTRVVIVLSLLRQAVGLPQLPPNPVLIGLALFTTLFVMAPVGRRIHQEALEPYSARQIDEATALRKAEAPVREFLLRQTREKDLALFQELSGEPMPEDPATVGIWTLLPAFTISEMKTAFEIGFMVYLPFLVIDLVVASMLISMGMIVLPPIVISLPFKLMLFVLLDGWGLVVGGLVRGIR